VANLVLGYPFYSDVSVSYTPALSGGSWEADLPLTNLQDRRLHKVARSTNDDAASTQFNIDLGVARSVGLLALPKHNLSAGATVQWKGGTSAGDDDVYDSGALALTFSGVSAEDRDGINFAHVHIPATAQSARHWTCEIVDTSNADGYVELGRLVIAGAYTPTINMNVGAKLGLETDTERSVTDGGAAVFNAKPVRRNAMFVLDHLTTAEAMDSAWKLQRKAGTAEQVFFVFDKSDTTYMHERAFLGTLRELSALEYAYVDGRSAMGFAVVEEL
jgi:hypothetical protein